MPENFSTMIRVVDQEALEMLRIMAEKDLRSLGNFTAWLIRQEYSRRYSQPNEKVRQADVEITK